MSTKNMKKEEAQAKLKKLVEDIKFAMMISGLDKKPLNAIPMTTKKVDDQGNIWFLSAKNSDHNQNIAAQNKVQLLYSDPSEMEFISIFGTAEIVLDKNSLKDLYDKSSDVWFSGLDDPNLSAIKFDPQEAYYWDSKSNKYITLFKLGVAALTGKGKDIGERGNLEL